MTYPAYLGGRLRSVVGVLGLAALAGCGGVTAATTPDGGAGTGGAGTGGAGAGAPDGSADEAAPVTAEEGCKRTAQALCDALDGCAPTAVKVLYGDKATCVARATLSCTTDQAVEGISRTGEDLAKCAHQLSTASCTDLLSDNYPDVCRVQPGKTISGAACGSDWQCASTYCRKTDAKCGVCGPRAAAGADCTASDGCEKGLVCANKKCVAPAAPGADCNLPNQPCRADLYCTAASGSGKCAAKQGSGAACADNSDACDFGKGVFCNPITKMCEPITVAKGGEACGLGLKTICVGFFDPCSNFLTGGVCANPAADGATCGGNAVCIPPAQCAGGVCRLPSAPECK
jgi:hypothetical protein